MALTKLLSWAAKLALTLSLMYSALFIANSLGVTFFSLVGGGMLQQTVSKVFLSQNLDALIWLTAVLVVLAYVLYRFHQKRPTKQKRLFLLLVPLFSVCLVFFGFDVSLFLAIASISVALFAVSFRWVLELSPLSAIRDLLLCFAFLLLFVQAGSLVSTLVLISPTASTLSPPAMAATRHLVLLDLSFANLLSPLLPLAYLILVFLGLTGIFIKVGLLSKAATWLQRPLSRRHLDFVGSFDLDPKENSSFTNGRFFLFLAFALSFVISSVLVLVTVLPWINPTYRLVSTDAPFYYQWLQDLHAAGFSGAMSLAFASDRSFFLILLYFLSAVIPSLDLVQLFAALLIPVFAVFCFFVTKLVGGPRETAVYAVLLAPLSIQALGLIFSGYFANMLGLLLVYLYYIVFIWAQRKNFLLGFSSLAAVAVLIVFAYPWAWFILALSMLAFLFMQWRLASSDAGLWTSFKTKLLLVFSSFLLSVIFDFFRRLLTVTSSVTIVYDTVARDLTFPNLSFLWNSLKVTADFYLGGAFGCVLIVFLSIVGFFVVLRSKSEMSSLLTSWVFVSSLAILFTGSEFAYHKFLFAMPLVVFSSLGLSWLMHVIVRKDDMCKKRFSAGALVLVVSVLILLCNALRFASNLIVL
ncbi:MAG: hypothetical protein ACBZ72_07775 [Candidatus Bathyarchaeia archaeon]|jgi:hypothetical protein